MTREELEQLLKNLHLERMAELLDEELAHANKDQLAYEKEAEKSRVVCVPWRTEFQFEGFARVRWES